MSVYNGEYVYCMFTGIDTKNKGENKPLSPEEAFEVFNEWQDDPNTESVTCAQELHSKSTDLPELVGVITKEGFRMECPECGYQRIALPVKIALKGLDKRDRSK